MKSIKKITAVALTICIFTFCSILPVSASVEGSDENPVTRAELESPTRIITADEFNSIVPFVEIEESIFVPRSNSEGTNGNECGEFVADGGSVSFTMTTISGGATTYNVLLYKRNSQGVGYPVGTYEEVAIGNGYSKSGLTEGAIYYFKISSFNVPEEGANGTFKVKTF